MLRHLRPAALLLGLFTLVAGFAYPLTVTGLARLAFPRAAAGSLIERGGRVVGSDWLGQPFAAPGYFWSRPSATGPNPYDGGASSGSNLGPTNPALLDQVAARIARLRAADAEAAGPVPADLVTASASGLDPHLSPAGALFQVRRVARARGLDEVRVRRLVEAAIEPRTFGILGEPRVNVLRLNLALDDLAAAPAAPGAQAR